MLERLPLLGGLALLAIAFVIGSFAIGHGIRDKNRNDVISVTGSAKQRIESDYVVWDISVGGGPLTINGVPFGQPEARTR